MEKSSKPGRGGHILQIIILYTEIFCLIYYRHDIAPNWEACNSRNDKNESPEYYFNSMFNPQNHRNAL